VTVVVMAAVETVTAAVAVATAGINNKINNQ